MCDSLGRAVLIMVGFRMIRPFMALYLDVAKWRSGLGWVIIGQIRFEDGWLLLWAKTCRIGVTCKFFGHFFLLTVNAMNTITKTFIMII